MNKTWMRKVAEVLRRAAHIHSSRGGVKHTMEDEKGRVCLWGAIAYAMGSTAHSGIPLNSQLGEQINMVLRQVFQGSGECATYPGASWNDRASTTNEDVEKLLLQVADQCEIGEVTLRVYAD